MKETPICDGNACKVLDIDTKVRAVLDEPRNILGEKQIGKFRSGDTRWSPEIRKIKQIILKPNMPPMYLINNSQEPNGIDKVPYTKNHLVKSF